MGAVDMDSQCNRKWYHTIWWFILPVDTCLNNTFILYWIHNQDLLFTCCQWYSSLCTDRPGLAEGGWDRLKTTNCSTTTLTILQWNLNTKVACPHYEGIVRVQGVLELRETLCWNIKQAREPL